MSRTLLLCFIHGFKGTDNTFHDFPYDLRKAVANLLPDDRVESVVYPKYETKGELAEATASFLEWLKERVMEIRKAQSDSPWPPHDRDVGVILVAHSMGGFVAADSLFLAIEERAANANDDALLFPLIQGILTFDTPYNGLARSMFVYGAFSNYQKVSSVFNVMTALSAAAPAGFARLGARNAAARSAASAAPAGARGPQWQAWQLVAVRTGTVGAIAAGGVAAYMNREAIIKGVKSVRNINKESIAEGYRQSLDTLGQGLAYVNRGNVGKSFAWLSDHFTFVGSLVKQKELNRRLERLGSLKGIGIRDFYCSLGENGYWSGGYFVPERTFCAVPEDDHVAHPLFKRWVMGKIDDEVDAHMSMFRPGKFAGYEEMTDDAASLVRQWFTSEEDVVDDPKFQASEPEEAAEEKEVAEILEKDSSQEQDPAKDGEDGDDEKAASDPSPIDIAAAASLVPLPDEKDGDLLGDVSLDDKGNEEKRNYLNHLFQVAQNAGSGLPDVRGWLPSKMPNMPNLPNMPKVPSAVSSLGNVSVPGMNMFTKKQPQHAGDQDDKESKEDENPGAAEPVKDEEQEEKK